MELGEREINLIERTFVVMGVVFAVVFSIFCLAIILWPAIDASAAEPPAKHTFVGVAVCSVCHKSDAKGNQFKHWQDSKHSHAYELLGTPAAKAVAVKAGLKGDPQKSPECLQCHVTALGVDKSFMGEKFHMEDGVQCESCHGAGGDFKTIKIMKDRKQAIANGLVIPDEKTCRGCHNEKAPTWDPKVGFNFKEMFKKIAHPLPKEKAPAEKK